MIPVLAPMLQPGEKILLQAGTCATTVYEGPGGFLLFRRWEAVQPPPVGPFILLGLVWSVTEDFMVGSMGREELRRFLGGEIRMGEAAGQISVAWYGVIMAEAGTTFRSGGTVIHQPNMSTLAGAQDWVVQNLARLLGAEEQVSQAVVLGPDGAAQELSPACWPHPDSPRSQLDWILIEDRRSEG